MDPVRLSASFAADALRNIGQSGAVAGRSERIAPSADFLKALEGALNKVNASQTEAAELSKKFQLNQADVSLEEIMVAMQKANIAFQAAVQVRNRLVSAYHDIMNMQI
jgi:flagellar hook-basal body complex protein FliE